MIINGKLWDIMVWAVSLAIYDKLRAGVSSQQLVATLLLQENMVSLRH